MHIYILIRKRATSREETVSSYIKESSANRDCEILQNVVNTIRNANGTIYEKDIDVFQKYDPKVIDMPVGEVEHLEYRVEKVSFNIH